MPPTHTDEGLRAARVIRAELPKTAVLVLSGYVEEDYAVELLTESAEGVGYLLKDRVADVSGSSTRSVESPPRKGVSPAIRPLVSLVAKGRLWRLDSLGER